MKIQNNTLIFSLILLVSCSAPQIEEPNNNTNDTVPTSIVDTVSKDTIPIVPNDTIPTIPDDTIINNSQDTTYSGGDYEPTGGAYMMIVKFADKGQVQNVIVGHPIKGYNGIWGYFEYIEDNGLSLNWSDNEISNDVLSREIVDFLTKETSIIGSSPYIPLYDDYYLIDWKWWQILPLSALTNVSDNEQQAEHIKKHIFMTDIKWSDLTDLTQKWENSQFVRNVNIAEIYRVGFESLDRIYNRIQNQERDPYLCYNMSLYYYGLNIENAYLYYTYRETSKCHNENVYSGYIAYCDSVQDVYKQYLIDVIRKNQLQKIGW